MTETPRLKVAYADHHCGCPVEEWAYLGLDLMIHFEPDDTIEVFADAGEWDHTFSLASTTMEGAREEVFTWVRSLPTE